jgi:hypothetical protein
MQSYNVGGDVRGYLKDEFDVPHGLIWFVYEYWEGSYEGGGEGVGLHPDGDLRYGRFDHCSCYGPMEMWGDGERITVAEFIREKDSVHDFDCSNAIREKVLELLGM